MGKKPKLTKLLLFFLVATLVLCFSHTAIAAQEFVLYEITYHCNYTPAVSDVVDFKYNDPSFTIKDVGTDPGECNFKHPFLLYLFQGWSLTPTGEVEYEPGDNYTFSGWSDQNLHLYAVWKPLIFQLTSYKVTYYPNYPPGIISTLLIYEDEYLAGATVTTRPASTYAGSDGTITAGDGTTVFQFAGWSLTRDGWVEYYPGESFIMPAKDVALYGVWTTKPILNRDDHIAYMQGYPDGTFQPNRYMTRAEAVVMFSRLLREQLAPLSTYSSTYTDLGGTWPEARNAIGYMQQEGVLSTPAPFFRPQDNITRAEFADLACGFENLTSGLPSVFSDVPTSHPYYDEINYAVARGWLSGYPDGTFKPNNPIKRAEVTSLVNKVLERYCDEDYVNTHTSSIKSYYDMATPASHWAYYQIMEASISHNYTKVGTEETWTSLK